MEQNVLKKMKQIIKESGEEQKDLAKALGLSPATLSKRLKSEEEPFWFKMFRDVCHHYRIKPYVFFMNAEDLANKEAMEPEIAEILLKAAKMPKLKRDKFFRNIRQMSDEL